MSSSPTDSSRLYSPFPSFAPPALLAQRWLDSFSEASQTMAEAMNSRDTVYPNMLAALMGRLTTSLQDVNAPALPNAMVHASAAMSIALAVATQQQIEMFQQWLAARQAFDASPEAARLPAQVAWLHGQSVHTLKQFRDIVDGCMDAWFKAAESIAETLPSASPGDAGAKDADGKEKSATPARGGAKRS